MKDRLGKIVLLLFVGALGASLAACGGDGSVQRSLVLRVFNADPGQSEGFPPSVLNDIIEVRFRIYQHGRERSDLTEVFDFDTFSARLPRLDFGDNYQIVVEGLDLDQNILADGATPIFDFDSDSSLREIQVFTSPLYSVEYASALYVAGSQVVAAPSEFEGPFVASDLGLDPEALGGQRAGHTVTPLPDGRVVVIGGARMTNSGGIAGSPFARFIDTIEVYDPANGYWSLVRDLAADPIEMPDGALVDAPMHLSVPRAFHTATLMDDGRILVAGGFYDTGEGRIDASSAVELVDPTKGTIEVLPEGISDLLDPRALHTAAWLDGKVWVFGGAGRQYDSPRYLNSVEVFDPEAGYFERAQDGDDPSSDLTVLVGRAMHESITLSDGVLVIGGRTADGVTSSMEFLQLNESKQLRRFFTSADSLPTMSTARFGHRALLLERDFENSTADDPTVYIAIAGGYTSADTAGDLLTGTALSSSVEFINERDFGPNPGLTVNLNTPRAHFAMVESSIARDLMVLGGVSTDGITTSVERLRRTVDGGFPLTRENFSALHRPRAFGPGVDLNTHNIMVVGGWEGDDNAGICGQTAPTAGCTSELANLGDLFYLGYLY